LITHEVNEIYVKPSRNAKQKKLFSYYRKVKEYRSNRSFDEDLIDALFKEVLQYFPDNWLLLLELHEICQQGDLKKILDKINDHLNILASKIPAISHLITEGLEFEN
jgi:hypothetical protein